jgi:hypothetical protein
MVRSHHNQWQPCSKRARSALRRLIQTKLCATAIEIINPVPGPRFVRFGRDAWQRMGD